jgi:cell division protein FtsB
VNPRQVILSLYLLLIAGLGVTGGYLFVDARAEYTRLKQVQALNQHRLSDAQERLKNQERVLDRLRNDPAFVEKVIRKKLLYSKPNEDIFRFED